MNGIAKRLHSLLVIACLLATAQPACAAEQHESIRIATWNIEHMNMFFDQTRLPYRSQERDEVWDDEEDLFEIKKTIELEHFDPDILVLQEAADQPSLEEFNTKWLNKRFAYVKAFKTNSDGQWTAIMVKPGFQVLEIREFADEKDPVNDPALGGDKRYYGGDVLFPRGPGFAKIRTPGGKIIWVGTTHIKSKGGNSVAATRWRTRMTERLRGIAGELRKDTDFVAVLGDFNDTFGKDRLEEQTGQDAVGSMLDGKDSEELVSPSKALAEANPNVATYHSVLKPGDPSFIDHVFVTPEMNEAITETTVIDDAIAYVASDHLPVMVTVKAAPSVP